jgi:hypothetical protein
MYCLEILMKRLFFLGLAVIPLFSALPLSAEASLKINNKVDHNNVIWNTPSMNESGSMPIGNGETALNVWCLKNGEILFYISRTDAWSGNDRLLKMGRIKIKLTPNPFADSFEQKLELIDGVIRVKGSGGAEKSGIAISIWVDANRDVIHIDGSSEKNIKVTASVELWRRERRKIKKDESHVFRELSVKRKKIPDVVIEPDTVLPPIEGALVWCHRNVKSCYPASLENQHLGDLLGSYTDPLMNRTFGALMSGGEDFSPDGKERLVSKKSLQNFHLKIYTLTRQSETLGKWVSAISEFKKECDAVSQEKSWSDHCSWWEKFWNRSWIISSGSKDAEFVTKMYALQRWVTACQGRGHFPVKFNGGLFTVGNDNPTRYRNVKPKTWDPDYRAWGGCYWFQNTRFPYWAMLAAGDYDMMQPLWKMYLDAIPLLEKRTEIYFHHKGVYFGETIFFWGLFPNVDFGVGNKGTYPTSRYIRYYYQSGLELIAMAMERYAQTRDLEFLEGTVLPLAEKVLEFYDCHFKRDKDGKLLITPAQSLETYQRGVLNPLPVVVGLKVVLTRLLNLPGKNLSPELRENWKRLFDALPSIPLKKENGKSFYAPAEKYNAKGSNSENPSLYTVFPYRLSAVGQPLLETGLNSWYARRVKAVGCWHQDFVQSAMLGLAEEAKASALKTAMMKDEVSRFSAFWTKGNDWMPDQDHGGNLMLGLQRMLIQWDDKGKIYILPAWPKDWPVHFKLRAVDNSVVEVRYSKGRPDVKIFPEIKKSDIVFPQWADAGN